MKLYYATTSPYSRKVRIVARECLVSDDIEEVLVNPFEDDARLLAANPAGLVPTLMMDNNTPLIDSPVICHYLISLSKNKTLLPDDNEQYWQVRQLEAQADAILDQALGVVMEKRRETKWQSPIVLARKYEKLERCLSRLPEYTDTPATTLTLGDIAIGCALSYLEFRIPDLNWRAQRPDLDKWQKSLNPRLSFQETRPGD